MSKKILQPDWTDLRNISISDVKIDATDPNNLSNNVLSERESRQRILTHARLNGCEKEMMLLFSKADKMLRNCKNDQERQDMGKLFCIEVYTLLGKGGELYVNGELVMKDN